ncbi:hypothetical protein SETIT_8G113900v2 [Setaria italica]|uniref:Uncharacterized protein n=1 Tax=Setaria italica TaxID=4555 RepID=A0A368S6Q4_SETIT|nr:hypothetical protein SETIT_8G113900v2 [Setaria italica]
MLLNSWRAYQCMLVPRVESKFAGDLGRCYHLWSEEARCSGADPISIMKLWRNYGEQTLVLLNQNYGDWRIG